MILQGLLSRSLWGLGFALLVTHGYYFFFFVSLISSELGSVSHALNASTFLLTILSSVWLWQYWLRPDWTPWGILLMATANMGLSVIAYLSVKWHTPQSKAITARGALITNGINVTLQAGFAIRLYFLLSRSFEPLVRSKAANSREIRTRILDLGAVCDQSLSHARDLLQLENLYQKHESLRKEQLGKLSMTFAPHTKLSGRPQFDHLIDYWAKSTLWNHLDCLIRLILWSLALYFPLTTVAAITYAKRTRSCDALCKLQMILTFAFGLWVCLVLFARKRHSYSGSKASTMNIRLGILLIITSVSCFLAILGEILYSLSTIGSNFSHRMLGIAACIRLGILILQCCLYAFRWVHN